MGRTIIVGDTHGCLTELMELLEKVKYLPATDRLILAGDLMDKGPSVLPLLNWAKNNRIECILGNHEDWYLRFHKHAMKEKTDQAYNNPMRTPRNAGKIAVYETIPVEILEWMATWPTYLKFGLAWFVSHAGLLPGKPIEAQDLNSLIRMRYVDPVKKKFAALNPDLSQPAGTVWWTDLYDQPINIVYGHAGWERQGAVVTQRKDGIGMTVGIDTGCVFGSYLTAAIFDGREDEITSHADPTFVDVKAKQRYGRMGEE